MKTESKDHELKCFSYQSQTVAAYHISNSIRISSLNKKEVAGYCTFQQRKNHIAATEAKHQQRCKLQPEVWDQLGVI